MRSTELEHVAAAFFGQAWALIPEKLVELRAILERRQAGAAPSTDEIEKLRAQWRTKLEAAEPSTAPRADLRNIVGLPVRQYGKVAVMPLYGVISQRMSWLSAYSGGTSTEQFGKAFDQLVADKGIKTIVFDIDSPGGSVFGVQELATKILEARGEKKLVAIANSTMASAAYWIAAAADTIYVTPSGMAGSIGVISVHEDYSAENELRGRKVTYVTAGKYKAEGNPDAPLDTEAMGEFQKTVDAYYDAFVKGVAKGRGVSEAKVRDSYGEGRVMTAARAVAAGLVDKVATLEQLLAKLGAEGASAGPSALAVRKQQLAEIEGA